MRRWPPRYIIPHPMPFPFYLIVADLPFVFLCGHCNAVANFLPLICICVTVAFQDPEDVEVYAAFDNYKVKYPDNLERIPLEDLKHALIQVINHHHI